MLPFVALAFAEEPPVAVGPFEVRVVARPETTVSRGGEVVATVWSWSRPEALLAPLAGHPGFEHAWLLTESQGDGCPTMLRALCVSDARVVVTEPFGNCSEVARVGGRRTLTFRFEPLRVRGAAARPATRVRLGPDCTIEAR